MMALFAVLGVVIMICGIPLLIVLAIQVLSRIHLAHDWCFLRENVYCNDELKITIRIHECCICKKIKCVEVSRVAQEIKEWVK